MSPEQFSTVAPTPNVLLETGTALSSKLSVAVLDHQLQSRLQNHLQTERGLAEKESTLVSGTAATSDIDQDTPDPFDKLAAEFTALRQPAKHIAIIGSRNISLPHQQLIEALAYVLARDGNTIITSGGSFGTNAAAIRGAMRANPDLLKVVLPQTIGHQPSDVQDQLIGVPNIIEHPEWQNMTLADASRLCNREIVDLCQQLIIYLYHDSTTQQTAIAYAEDTFKIVTAFYFD